MRDLLGWAGALYSPKWTSTTYTLLLLERLGLEPGDPAALAGFYRSHRTGEVVDRAFARFPFPPQWRNEPSRR